MTTTSPNRGPRYVPRLSLKQRRVFREEVEHALREAGAPPGKRIKRGCCDPKLLQAIERTARLLQYESCATPAARWFTSRIRDIRERHWKGPKARYRYPLYSPRTMLARVLEFYALLNGQPARFPTANIEHEALGRAFLLTARGRRTWRATWYRGAGRYIAQELGSFCIPFIRNNVAPLLEAEDNYNIESQHGS